MNKAIVLPSQRFIVSRIDISFSSVGGHIARINTTESLNVNMSDLLPMACALVEVYEILAKEKSEDRARHARYKAAEEKVCGE